MKKFATIIIAMFLMVFTVNTNSVHAQGTFHVDTDSTKVYNITNVTYTNYSQSFFQYGDSLYWNVGKKTMVFDTSYIKLYDGTNSSNSNQSYYTNYQHYQKLSDGTFVGYNADNLYNLSPIYSDFNKSTNVWSNLFQKTTTNSHRIFLNTDSLTIDNYGHLSINGLTDTINQDSIINLTQFSQLINTNNYNYLAQIDNNTAYYCYGYGYNSIKIDTIHYINGHLSHGNFLTYNVNRPNGEIVSSAWISLNFKTVILTTIDNTLTANLIILHSKQIDAGIIENIKKVLNISLYPNPTIDEINVSFETSTKIAIVAIYNILGEVISSKEIECNMSQNNVKFDVSSYINGIYIVRINDTESKRFIKQ